MQRRAFAGLLASLALLPGCAATGGAGTGTGGTANAPFFDVRSGERLGRRRALRRMEAASILLLGEIHDNTAHHRIRASLLLDWVRSEPQRPAAIVFEQLDREQNEALRLAQKQQATSEARDGAGANPDARMTALLEAAGFDSRSWGWPAHLPLFRAAQASGAMWIAANLSRTSAQRLTRDPDAVADPVLQAVVESARWSEQAQQALAQALMQGHCNAISASLVAAIARIQRLRDAALALPLLDANERRSILLAGNGHVRRDHGVPLYLGAYEKEALVVGFEEVASLSSAGRLADLVGESRGQDLARAYDLVCLTPPTVGKGDPCAAMMGASPSGGAAVSPATPTQTPSR